MANERKRQFIHILLVVLAFGLKYLTRWQAAGLLLLLLGFTLFLVPCLGLKFHLCRSRERNYSPGAIFYFLTLLILVLIFPLPVVSASWAILALGDGMATLVGRNFKTAELPWNKNKTYGGSAAFLILGLIGAVALLWWSGVSLSFNQLLFISLKTVIIATIVESLPLKINDNISVPVVSALVLQWLLKI